MDLNNLLKEPYDPHHYEPLYGLDAMARDLSRWRRFRHWLAMKLEDLARWVAD